MSPQIMLWLHTSLIYLLWSTYSPFNSLHTHVVKYADDVILLLPVYKSDHQDLTLVRNEVPHFENWCNTHGMLVNKSKTKVLCVQLRGNFAIPVVPEFDNVAVLKILGLYFNKELTWTEHFEFISKKASQKLYVLRILKSFLSHD